MKNLIILPKQVKIDANEVKNTSIKYKDQIIYINGDFQSTDVTFYYDNELYVIPSIDYTFNCKFTLTSGDLHKSTLLIQEYVYIDIDSFYFDKDSILTIDGKKVDSHEVKQFIYQSIKHQTSKFTEVELTCKFEIVN